MYASIVLLVVVVCTILPLHTSFSIHPLRSNAVNYQRGLYRFNQGLYMQSDDKKKWDESSLSKVDYFADDDDDLPDEDESEENASDAVVSSKLKKEKKKGPSIEDLERARGAVTKDKKAKKPKFKLEPETIFYDGPPSSTEVLLPAISILTVIGIIPFVAAMARQIWVRYKFTSRRISIQSGIGGKTQTEIIYPDVQEIRYAFRGFGASGDMVLFLKDGAKVELRHVPKFQEVYEFVLSKCDVDCQQKSMKITPKAS